MTQIKWKSEASARGNTATAAKNIGGGQLGDAEIELRQSGDKITVTVNGTPCLEYVDDDGDVTNIKLLKAGQQELADAFNSLIDL